MLLGGLALAGAASAGERIVPPDPELLARYRACSAEAATRGMGPGEAQACAWTYLLLKLSLLPGVDLETFRSLDPAGRQAVQQEGYAAYLAWKAQSGTARAFGAGGM